MKLVLPLGTLAWAPFEDAAGAGAGAGEVAGHEAGGLVVLDRFNGVPTLGFFVSEGQPVYFWRAFGYVTDAVAMWVYVPTDEITQYDAARFPDGLLFDSPVERSAYVAVTDANRIAFEREWTVPPGLDPDELLHDMAHHMMESLQIAVAHQLPSGRREVLARVSKAVADLSTPTMT